MALAEALAPLAYVAGLLAARGRAAPAGAQVELRVELGVGRLMASGTRTVVRQREELLAGLGPVQNAVQEALHVPVWLGGDTRTALLEAALPVRGAAWRTLRSLLPEGASYADFRVDPELHAGPRAAVRQFLRGFADAAGRVRASNRDRAGRHRVYLEVAHRNWAMPIALCRLLQEGLGVPVQCILWGHPNVRTPGEGSWRKEHQVRCYAEHFLAVGFTVPYKQRILAELAQANSGRVRPADAPCDPADKPAPRPKPAHRDESSADLPAAARGHFDGYWQVCVALGCYRCPPTTR